MALLRRALQLELPLAPDEVLARLARAPTAPDAPRLVRHEGVRVVLRVSASAWLPPFLDATARGQVLPLPGGGSHVQLALRPTALGRVPLVPLALLSVGGGAVAAWDGAWALLTLVPLVWAAALLPGLLGGALLAGAERVLVRYLESLPRG